MNCQSWRLSRGNVFLKCFCSGFGVTQKPSLQKKALEFNAGTAMPVACFQELSKTGHSRSVSEIAIPCVAAKEGIGEGSCCPVRGLPCCRGGAE